MLPAPFFGMLPYNILDKGRLIAIAIDAAVGGMLVDQLNGHTADDFTADDLFKEGN